MIFSIYIYLTKYTLRITNIQYILVPDGSPPSAFLCFGGVSKHMGLSLSFRSGKNGLPQTNNHNIRGQAVTLLSHHDFSREVWSMLAIPVIMSKRATR